MKIVLVIFALGIAFALGASGLGGTAMTRVQSLMATDPVE